MNNVINKKLSMIVLGLSLSCTVLSHSVSAAQRSEQEKNNEIIGLSSGVILGTAIAGPLGGIIAGVFGVMIADDVNSDKKLESAVVKLQEREQQLIAMQREYKQMEQDSHRQLASMDKVNERLSPEVESNIQFRTASYVLEEHYKSQLDLVAKNLQDNPKLTITLSGFADHRGDSNYNQALSEQRAISVKTYLINKGVSNKQVLTNSYGESELVSAGSNSEDNFFDRRVVLKLADNENIMTAAYK